MKQTLSFSTGVNSAGEEGATPFAAENIERDYIQRVYHERAMKENIK